MKDKARADKDNNEKFDLNLQLFINECMMWKDKLLVLDVEKRSIQDHYSSYDGVCLKLQADMVSISVGNLYRITRLVK